MEIVQRILSALEMCKLNFKLFPLGSRKIAGTLEKTISERINRKVDEAYNLFDGLLSLEWGKKTISSNKTAADSK